MKKGFTIALSTLAVSTVASMGVWAATLGLADVNAKVTALMAPFNDSATQLVGGFTALSIDQDKTLEFGFAGSVSKIGSKNTAKLEIKNAHYTYGDGTKPTIDLEAGLEIDLLKAFNQKMINDFGSGLDEIMADFAKDFVKEYGAAAKVSVSTVNMTKDANGNIQNMTIAFNAAMDFANLPAGTTVQDVELQTFDATMSLSLKGAQIQAKVVANPQYRGFQKDGQGLKEYIEKLLNDDAQMYQQIQGALGTFNGFAGFLVELSPAP